MTRDLALIALRAVGGDLRLKADALRALGWFNRDDRPGRWYLTRRGSTLETNFDEACKIQRRRDAARKPRDDAFIAGIILALAEVHRAGASDSAVVAVVRDAGLTLSRAKAAGADPYDLTELEKAGVE